MRKLSYGLLLMLVVLAACGRGEVVMPVEPTVYVPPREATAIAQAATSTAAALVTPDADATEETVATEEGAVLVGDAANGEVLFNELKSDVGFACATCHNATQDVRNVGPSLVGLAERAATRVEGQTAEEYIHDSILNPNAFIVPADPPFPENLMPQTYSEVWTEEQLSDIIAYLLTL